MDSSYPAKVWAWWQSAQIPYDKLSTLTNIAFEIMQNQGRYEYVGNQCGCIPFQVVGLIHYREAAFNFKTHLANGDPLFDHFGNPIVTTHVPKGIGPFQTWEAGAIAALKLIGFDRLKDWDLVSTLIHLETWNGVGYQKHNVLSPYIWSFTNLYQAGKYESDGDFNPTLIDAEAGCAAILSVLKNHNEGLIEKAP